VVERGGGDRKGGGPGFVPQNGARRGGEGRRPPPPPPSRAHGFPRRRRVRFASARPLSRRGVRFSGLSRRRSVGRSFFRRRRPPPARFPPFSLTVLGAVLHRVERVALAAEDRAPARALEGAFGHVGKGHELGSQLARGGAGCVGFFCVGFVFLRALAVCVFRGVLLGRGGRRRFFRGFFLGGGGKRLATTGALARGRRRGDPGGGQTRFGLERTIASGGKHGWMRARRAQSLSRPRFAVGATRARRRRWGSGARSRAVCCRSALSQTQSPRPVHRTGPQRGDRVCCGLAARPSRARPLSIESRRAGGDQVAAKAHPGPSRDPSTCARSQSVVRTLLDVPSCHRAHQRPPPAHHGAARDGRGGGGRGRGAAAGARGPLLLLLRQHSLHDCDVCCCLCVLLWLVLWVAVCAWPSSIEVYCVA